MIYLILMYVYSYMPSAPGFGHTYAEIYRKQQKFRGTKLSRFTGFYQNVGKTFAFLLQL